MQSRGLIEERGADGEVKGYRENPEAENLAFLPKIAGKPYYINAIAGKTKAWIDANALNRVSARKEGKPVLPDFNRQVHVAKQKLEPIPGLPLVIGLDFARRPAAVVMQCLRGVWYVLGELIGRDMGASKFAPLLKNKLAQEYHGFEFQMYGDPSGDFKGQADEKTPFMIF